VTIEDADEIVLKTERLGEGESPHVSPVAVDQSHSNTAVDHVGVATQSEQNRQKLDSSKIPVIEQCDIQGGTWRLEPEIFEAGRINLEADEAHTLSPKIKKFYEKQNSMIDAFIGVNTYNRLRENEDDEAAEEEPTNSAVSMAIALSFGTNIILVFIKLGAAIMSGSLSVLASFMDSFLDIVAGLILYWTSLRMAKRDLFKYPEGKTRLEPVGTVLFASVMGMASLQILVESAKRFVTGFEEGGVELHMSIIPISVLVLTIVSKTALYFYCSWVAENENSPTVEAYAQDHGNDIITNCVATACAMLGAMLSFLW
jgi:hypothetical protein